MRKIMFLGTMVLALSALARSGFSQSQQSPDRFSGSAASHTATQATAQAGSAMSDQAAVAANTQINAVLESTIDAKKANPGDDVSAKVTKDVKQDGAVVIHKGDRLLGKVVSAEANGAANSESQLAVQFDRLKSGEATTALQTVVTSVLKSSAAFDDQSSEMQGPAPTAMPAPPASGGGASGGGLLGGVGSTVGSTLGAAGSIGHSTGGVLDGSAGSTLGTSGSIAGSAIGRGIRVEPQGSASQSAGLNSVFSSPQGNVRVDSGTNLQFRVVGQTENSDPAQSK